MHEDGHNEARLIGAELELQHARGVAIQSELRRRDLEHCVEVGLLDPLDEELATVREAARIYAAQYETARAAHAAARLAIKRSAQASSKLTRQFPRVELAMDATEINF